MSCSVSTATSGVVKPWSSGSTSSAGWVLAAAVSLVGFLARPLGAWLMGLYADRRGELPMLRLAEALDVRLPPDVIDHPLADAKESRRIISDFPRDAFKAMSEIAIE